MSTYIGARYIGNDAIVIGKSGAQLKTGDVTKEIPEWEAKGRHDFEPVYEGTQSKKTASSEK